MALFNDTNCQVCERFPTKEQCNNHLHSSRLLHREVNGHCPAYFSQKELTRVEGGRLEKAFWEMIYGSENALAVYGFLKTNFRMVTNVIIYVKDDEDADDLGYHYRSNMITQFKQDFYIKSFSHQDQNKRDDSLQKRINFWLSYLVVNEGAPIPDSVYD